MHTFWENASFFPILPNYFRKMNVAPFEMSFKSLSALQVLRLTNKTPEQMNFRFLAYQGAPVEILRSYRVPSKEALIIDLAAILSFRHRRCMRHAHAVDKSEDVQKIISLVGSLR